MKLLDFITYCTLKNYVEKKEDINIPHDTGADSHHKITIRRGEYKASIVYAIMHDQGVIVSAHLYKRDGNSFDSFPQPSVGDLVRAFVQ